MEAPDFAAQKQIAAEIQQTSNQEVPFYTLGQLFQPTAYKASLDGMLSGFPIFWNVKSS